MKRILLIIFGFYLFVSVWVVSAQLLLLAQEMAAAPTVGGGERIFYWLVELLSMVLGFGGTWVLGKVPNEEPE